MSPVGIWRTILSTLLLIAVIILAFFYFRSHGKEFVSKIELSYSFIILMSLLIILFQFMAGLKIKFILDIFGLDLKTKEWFGLAQMNSFLNYLPLKGGAAAKAFYLKGFFDFPYSKFLAVLGASFIITIASFSAVGVAGMFLVYLKTGISSLNILLIYIFLTIAPLIPFLFLDRTLGRIKNPHIMRFFEGWRMIRKGGKRLFLLIIVDMMMVLVDAMRIKLSYGAQGVDLDYYMGLVLSPLSNLAAIASQVPAGLGIRETVVGLISGGMGMGFEMGVDASTLDRMILLFWIVLLGSFSTVNLIFYRGYSTRDKKT